MYIQQKGFLPAITSSIAVILFVVVIVGSIFSIFDYWVNIRLIYSEADVVSSMINVSVSYIILVSIFTLISLFLGGMFPDLKVNQSGIGYRYFLFIHGIVKWNEIKAIDNLKKIPNYKVIVVSRKGFILVNGLWLNMLYGLITGFGEPVLLISSKFEQREKILIEIGDHINKALT
jgi:hypothetical protein